MIIKTTNFEYLKNLIPLKRERVEAFILHHIGIEEATPEQIHQWHIKKSYWGFGYNEYIKKDGTIYIGRGESIGAQCHKFNSRSYGVACEGNYDIQKKMPDRQFITLVNRLKYLKETRYAGAEILPHNFKTSTECPGKYFPMSQVKIGVTMPFLKIGSNGESVSYLQHILSNKGFLLQLDGIFGVKTQSTVKQFQKNNNLVVDGLVGCITWSNLIGW